MKSSGVGDGGCRGCKRTPKSFDLLKILAKALQKENPGKNGAQRCLILKNDAQGWHKNT